MSLYFSLQELSAVASLLETTGTVTTADLRTACAWNATAAWSEAKQMEKLRYIEKLDKPPFNSTDTVRWRLSTSGALQMKINAEQALVAQNAGAIPRFIRCGNWCICGKSMIGNGPDFELGVSAYAARMNKAAWQPTDRAFWRKNFISTRYGLPWYLLTGTIIGTGSDGEPLLASARAVAALSWDQTLEVFSVLSTLPPEHPRSDHPQCSPRGEG